MSPIDQRRICPLPPPLELLPPEVDPDEPPVLMVPADPEDAPPPAALEETGELPPEAVSEPPSERTTRRMIPFELRMGLAPAIADDMRS